jgi:hypothetical protein
MTHEQQIVHVMDTLELNNGSLSFEELRGENQGSVRLRTYSLSTPTSTSVPPGSLEDARIKSSNVSSTLWLPRRGLAPDFVEQHVRSLPYINIHI